MFAKRYSPAELIDIIAAPSYSPEIIEYVKKVAKAPFLSQFLSQKPKLGITGTIAKDYVSADTPEAVPYISTKQVNGLHAYIYDAKYISKEADIDWAKCRVEDGDIIINKSGNVGAAAVLCCAPYKYANSVSDIINIKLANSEALDRDYLVVYLNSPYGQKQLQRLSGGAIFSHVSLHAIPEIRVFHLDIKAQNYIGDKVRQAEQLRAWAKGLEHDSNTLFTKAFDDLGYRSVESKNFVWTELENRLDPAFYNHKFYFFKERWFRENSQPLVDFIESGSYGVLPSSNSYGSGSERFVRATDMVAANIDPMCHTLVPSDQVTGKAKINIGDILLEIKGAINSCELAGVGLSGAYVNGSIFRFTPKCIEPGYLAYFLKSFIKDLYCERVSVNNIISYLDLDSLKNLPVLRLTDEQEKRISTAAMNTLDAKRYSFSLTQTSKFLVEALIEGQLTEQQLIDAQQALEAGDNSLDQAILARLTPQGFNADPATNTKPESKAQSQALFSDLDELYNLLAQANEAAHD